VYINDSIGFLKNGGTRTKSLSWLMLCILQSAK